MRWLCLVGFEAMRVFHTFLMKMEVMQAYYRVYKENIPVPQLCRETAAVMQEFTRKDSIIFPAAVTLGLR